MAIVQPSEMDFSDKKFSVIIYGAPGIGKSTLAFSAPNALMFDFDGGVSRVKAQHRKATAIVGSYEELLEDMKSPEFAACETVIIDTGGSLITYLQDYVMRQNPVNRQKNGGISQKGFGAVKAEFVSFTNRLKDIHKKNIVYIFHSVEEKDKDGNAIHRLLCEGSAKNIVWQPCDLGAFMHVSGDHRVLDFSPTDEYFAKGCYGVTGTIKIPFLDAETPNDFLTRLFESARKSIAEEGMYFEAERKLYDAAMEKGLALVESVADVDTATAFQNEFKSIPHALTSEREIKAAFKARIDALGLKYNSAAKQYEERKEEA